MSIDEELLLWYERLEFKQYIPNKRSRKRFWNENVLPEVLGHLWNSLVYVGKDTLETKRQRDKEKEMVKKLVKSSAVVYKLMGDLFGMGYQLYVNNWCTSQRLCHYLYENETVEYSTAIDYCLNVPKSLKVQPLREGNWSFRGNEEMLMARPKDKKEIFFLSTIHSMKTEKVPKSDRQDLTLLKLKLVIDYNKYIRCVDHNDA